jgi:ubiquinone/menaquinone biosynthesis C-methylase UbiE
MARRSTGALDDDVRIEDQLNPKIDFSRPRRGGDELLHIVGDLAGKRVLDIGCGLGPWKAEIERRGAEWVGLDFKGPACSVIADGCRLPFRDGSFDGVLCAAVLEHVPDLDMFMAEIRRALAHRGVLFGYVAFLEPFHGLSYYHMTHLGLEHLLVKHGFRPERIFAARNGTAYQIESVLFPRYIPVVQPMVRAITQWSMSVTMWFNCVLRTAYKSLTSPRGGGGNDAARYRELLALRFAVGFNFVATRTDSAGTTTTYTDRSGPTR